MEPRIENTSEYIIIKYGDIFSSFYNHSNPPVIMEKAFHKINQDLLSFLAKKTLNKQLQARNKSIDDVKIYSSTITVGCDTNLSYILSRSKKYIYHKETELNFNRITYFIAKV